MRAEARTAQGVTKGDSVRRYGEAAWRRLTESTSPRRCRKCGDGCGWRGRDALGPPFAGWIALAPGAAGVFGFSRATAAVVTRATPPPAAGAAGERTQP